MNCIEAQSSYSEASALELNCNAPEILCTLRASLCGYLNKWSQNGPLAERSKPQASRTEVQSPAQRRGVCCTRPEPRGVFRVRAPSVISSPSLFLAACSPRSSSGRAHGESERIPWPPRPRPTNTLSLVLSREISENAGPSGAEPIRGRVSVCPVLVVTVIVGRKFSCAAIVCWYARLLHAPSGSRTGFLFALRPPRRYAFGAPSSSSPPLRYIIFLPTTANRSLRAVAFVACRDRGKPLSWGS